MVWFHYAASAFNQCPIHPLGNTVQLRSVRQRKFLHNATVHTQLGHRTGGVFATIVTTNNLHALASLGFHPRDEFCKLRRHFRLVLEQK